MKMQMFFMIMFVANISCAMDPRFSNHQLMKMPTTTLLIEIFKKRQIDFLNHGNAADRIADQEMTFEALCVALFSMSTNPNKRSEFDSSTTRLATAIMAISAPAPLNSLSSP